MTGEEECLEMLRATESIRRLIERECRRLTAGSGVVAILAATGFAFQDIERNLATSHGTDLLSVIGEHGKTTGAAVAALLAFAAEHQEPDQ